jgi:hypothetical protein
MHLTGRGIGKPLDTPDPLLEFVERGRTAPLQRLPIQGRNHALGLTVEQLDAECVFEIGDDGRYGRLGHAKLCRGLGHAAPLHHGEEQVQVAQP